MNFLFFQRWVDPRLLYYLSFFTANMQKKCTKNTLHIYFWIKNTPTEPCLEKLEKSSDLVGGGFPNRKDQIVEADEILKSNQISHSWLILMSTCVFRFHTSDYKTLQMNGWTSVFQYFQVFISLSTEWSNFSARKTLLPSQSVAI